MKLKKVTLENFRCFEKLELDLHERLTVLVAKNGDGKTAAIEGIMYLLGFLIRRYHNISAPRYRLTDYRRTWRKESTRSGKKSISDPLKPYMRIAATADVGQSYEPLEWGLLIRRDSRPETLEQISKTHKNLKPNNLKFLDSFINYFVGISGDEISATVPIFAYFSTERAVVRKRPERRRMFKKEYLRSDAFVGALDGQLDYKKMIEWFCYLEENQNREMKEVKDWDYKSIEIRTIQLAIEKMLPGFTNLCIRLKPLNLVVDVQDESGLKTCSIDEQLSDGYKIVLVLVVDVVSRILEANLDCPGITPKQLLDSTGVVLIDEVDLHLHPKWQQHILNDLQRTFPKIQFIVTTHSPQVISSVPCECVRIIDEGVVHSAEIKTEGARAEQVLNEIFGVESRASETKAAQALQEYRKLMEEGKWDSEIAQKLKVYLSEALSTDPELAKLAMEIHIKDYQRRHSDEKNQ